jgi:hypothetical protein
VEKHLPLADLRMGASAQDVVEESHIAVKPKIATHKFILYI